MKSASTLCGEHTADEVDKVWRENMPQASGPGSNEAPEATTVLKLQRGMIGQERNFQVFPYIDAGLSINMKARLLLSHHALRQVINDGAVYNSIR